MKALKVGFQGETGSFSEEAVLQFFEQAEAVPFQYFSMVFGAVADEMIDHGMVPVENSQAGTINDTYDLLLQHDLNIIGEFHLRIKHCLMALPGECLETLNTIYSHPQALAQCEKFLSSLNVNLIPTYDTAGSAKMIKQENLNNAGAIASKRVSTIYGMNLLAEGIETNPQNFTRFFAISKSRSNHTGPSKTSIIFRTKNIPGALYKGLGAFANRDINLCKLESRPARDTPWEYIFYLDFEGHAEDKNCSEAIMELETKCAFLKLLGSYPYVSSTKPE